MTAEVAVLNRNAVALAADSAVTLQLPEGPKIYHTNKLFTLSKYRPVGVMVYGAAEFMRVPWETIVKQYRSHLGQKGFDRLEQYAGDFLRFLEANRVLFPADAQGSACSDLAHSWAQRLKVRLHNRVEEHVKSQGRISEESVRSIFRKLVHDDIAHLRKRRNIANFSRMRPASLLRRYKNVIQEALATEFQGLRDVVPVNRLRLGCALAILKDLYWYNDSGVVVAGFGNREFLPSLHCYKVGSIIGERLRFLEDETRRSQITTSGVTASVIAFAQSEMVALFMNGIDREYEEFVNGFFGASIFQGYPLMLEGIMQKSIAPKERGRILKKLRTVAKQALRNR